MANALFTCALAQENKQILEQKKDKEGWKLGQTVNTLISTFGLLPDSIKSDLLLHVKEKLRELIDQMDQAGPHELGALSELMEKYLQIAAYLNDGKEISLDAIKKEQMLCKIPIKNGILIAPKNYVLVNPDESLDFEYACILECRNHERYQLPVYLICCDKKYGSTYDDDYRTMLIQKVIQHDPNFRSIVDMQVEPLHDPEHPCKLLNQNAYQAAPTIGLFSVYEHGDPAYPSGYKPPAGVEIIRSNLLD